jgi:hypothetical protein
VYGICGTYNKTTKGEKMDKQGLELASIILNALADATTNVGSEDIQKVIRNPKPISDFFGELFAEKSEIKPTSSVLGEVLATVTVGSCDGKVTIADSNTFAWKDEDLKNWDLNTPSKATPETVVEVRELTADAIFAKMFADKSKFLTQAQIDRFCAENQDQLSRDGGTFFLTKKENTTADEYFVVGVDVDDDGLYARVHHLEYGSVWCAEYHHRVVVPQL